MREDKDNSSKWLIEHHGGALLRLSGISGFTSWRTAHTQRTHPTQMPDGLLEVIFPEHPEPDLFVLEVATFPERRAEEQAARDAALVWLDRGVVPDVVTLVLHPKGKVRVSGQWQSSSRRGAARLAFTWTVVEMWTLSAENLLALNDVGLIPWVPLAQTERPPEALLRQCRERIEQQAKPALCHTATGYREVQNPEAPKSPVKKLSPRWFISSVALGMIRPLKSSSRSAKGTVGAKTVTDSLSHAPDAIPEISIRQRAILLDQIARSSEGKLGKGDANRAIPAAIKRELGLKAPAANQLRAALVAEGLLTTERQNRKDYFQLTDRGRDYLEQHRQEFPVTPRGRGKGIVPPSNENVRRYRISYLLLQLLKAEQHTLSQPQANRFDALGKRLELNAVTATSLRHELAAQGLLTISRPNRFETYSLTPEGRLKLGTLAFDTDFEFKLRGRILNDLLEAAREAAREFSDVPGKETKPTVDAASATDAAEAVSLEDAIFRAFDELLRERHTVTGMVPIHEVRIEVRKHLGEAAARHDVFDAVIFKWWQDGRFRLIPITDGTQASLEQLQASLPGTGETLFFLESVHEPVAR
jgi:predicted transcriptional regulator